MHIKNLETDEIRSGFLVTSSRKKLWDAQIGLIVEFQRICEKHGIKYFAAGGTLLGAARHQGFIPWDDDVDFYMLRKDYDKLKLIAPMEFHYPYRFDPWYDNEDLPDNSFGFPRLPLIRIRDQRTMMLERVDPFDVNQEIWIDIFIMESMPPFKDKSTELKFRALVELTIATFWREDVIKSYQDSKNPDFLLDWDFVQRFIALSLSDRGKILESQISKFDFPSEYVGLYWYISQLNIPLFERSWFDEVIYLPFEDIMLPAPKNFDQMLRVEYGDWHEIKLSRVHSSQNSSDISYQNYLAIKDQSDDINGRENSLRSRINLDEIRDGCLIQSSRKKFWKVQIELVEELKKFDVKFWASSETAYATKKFHGFDPENDIITFEMTHEDLEKLEFKSPFRLIKNSEGGGELLDERTTFVRFPEEQNRPQGIFIEIKTTDQIPSEIEYLPFEFISIPIAKDRSQGSSVVRKILGDRSADISYEEYFKNIKHAIFFY